MEDKIVIAKEAVWLYSKFGEGEYHDIAGLCKIAYTKLSEKKKDDDISIEEKNWSLTPGAFVGIAPIEDDGVDFYKRMNEIHIELKKLQDESNQLMSTILQNLREMGI